MEKVVSELLLDIAQEKWGYSIGDPWRFTKHSLAAVVPIVRVDHIQARDYRLLSERKDEIKIKDTGDIEVVSIFNTGEYPILIKAGEILVGSTQSRTVTISQVVMAGERADVSCACVYSSKGIREGQGMTPDVYSPVEVRRTVYAGHYRNTGKLSSEYRRGQSHVWGSINYYSMTAADRTRSMSGFTSYIPTPDGPISQGIDWVNPNYRTPSEDLAGRVKEAQTKYEEVLRMLPRIESQVGMVLMTIEGFESMEVFEHPDSWEGLRRSILGADVDKIFDIRDQGGIFNFRPEKAKDVIRTVLMDEYDDKVALEKERTKTYVLANQRFIGEVVTLDDDPIHCSFVKKAS